MNNSEIKALIKSKLEEKKILGDILKELQVEHNINITFMELKMLAAEIDDFDWSTLDKKVEKKPEDKENIEESSGTVIEINKIARADWLLDSYGRLTLDNKIGDPTAEDIEEFQLELQKALSK